MTNERKLKLLNGKAAILVLWLFVNDMLKFTECFLELHVLDCQLDIILTAFLFLKVYLITSFRN